MLVHEFTGEVSVALLEHRGPKTVLHWQGCVEEPDEMGYIAGGWKMTENPNFSPPERSVTVENDFIDTKEFVDFDPEE